SRDLRRPAAHLEGGRQNRVAATPGLPHGAHRPRAWGYRGNDAGPADVLRARLQRCAGGPIAQTAGTAFRRSPDAACRQPPELRAGDRRAADDFRTVLRRGERVLRCLFPAELTPLSASPRATGSRLPDPR